MRASRSIVIVIVAALFTAMLVVTPTSAATEPVVAVTPTTDLVDGQTIHVAVSGAAAGAAVFTQFCATVTDDDFRCNQGVFVSGRAGDTGALDLDLGVDATFPVYDNTTVDCRVAPGCEVLTILPGPDDEENVLVRTPVAFRADGPLLPPPTIAIAPAVDLVDGTLVRVTAAGLVPQSQVLLVQCTASSVEWEDCEQPRQAQEVGSGGTLVTDFDVTTILVTNNGETVDCRLVACALVAARQFFPSDPRHSASAPLAFRPDGPLRPPPVLSVTPNALLVDGQSVQVSGSGFRPGPIVVSQCAVGTDDSYNRCSGDAYVIVDSSGNVLTTLPVAVLAHAFGGYADCRVAPGCTIAARSDSSGRVLVEAPISFDPSGPSPTLPTVTVAPANGLAARGPVIVAGQDFPPDRSLNVRECRIEDGLPAECSSQGETYVETDANGRFIAGALVTAVIGGANGAEIDCREVTCALVADEFSAGYPGLAPLHFAPAPAENRRYLAPVFDEVEVTDGVVYRHTTNSRGEEVDLTLDIYRPKGDTETRRPAVMWMFGGYFGSGERKQLQDLANAMARRGYVSVAIDYRTRPEIFGGTNGCVDVGGTCLDPTQLGPAISDARDDGRAAMVWLHDHAAEYGIEPTAISAAGWSAGAVTALNLAHDITGDPPAAAVPAAAVSLAGILTSVPRADDPPSMMLGGNHDSLLAISGQVGGCSVILAAGGHCEFVEYAGARPAPEADACVKLAVPCTYVLGRDQEHGFLFSERPDVIARMSEFLAREVLVPAGLLPGTDPDHHPHHPHHPRPHRPHRHHHHHHRDHRHRHHG